MTADLQSTWRELHEGLRTFVARRVSNDAEIDDILQEVFLRMHRRLDTLRDVRRLVPWVYQITRHAIVDHYRSPGRRRELPVGLASDIDEVYSVGISPVPEGPAQSPRQELARCLRPMIDKLGEPHREAVRLVELEGLTQSAAARRLGLSVSGMKSRVQRGRKELRQMLDACCLIQLDRRGGITDYAPRLPDGGACGCSESGERSR